eukprot:scaffold8404_cov305-Pinguiococcus_pyrenoidosus.AAC.3
MGQTETSTRRLEHHNKRLLPCHQGSKQSTRAPALELSAKGTSHGATRRESAAEDASLAEGEEAMTTNHMMTPRSERLQVQSQGSMVT